MEKPQVKHLPREVDVTETTMLVVTTTGLPPFIRDDNAIWCETMEEARNILKTTPDGKLWRSRLLSTTSVSEWENVEL